ncbi:MAG: hypothetical protein R2794_02090 [Chitinophagales bacterium]
MIKPLSSIYYKAQLYYPFGMVMPGRTWEAAGGYRYGFNGQEQDDEISGNGNFNTAEFWEYDTRLGRRWNVDPIVKPFLSFYQVYSNNPIIRVDFLGDDDYFDLEGNYLGTDRNGSHLIKVITDIEINDDIYSDWETKTIDPNKVLNWCFIADFTYDYQTMSSYYNAFRLAKITKHYTGFEIYPEPYGNPNSPASTSDHMKINTYNGKIRNEINNYYELKSIINDHEKLHLFDHTHTGPGITFKRHAEIYINQIGKKNFKESNDKQFQRGIIASGVNYAINSYIQESNSFSRQEWQDKFNTALKENGINMQVTISGGNGFSSITYKITDLDNNTESGPYFADKLNDAN